MQWKITAVIALCVAAILGSTLQAAAAGAAAVAGRTVEARLANGMKVIILENHTTPVATFQIWYRAGSRKEQWGKTGLAHVFEHLMFKGTRSVGPREFVRTITANGGSYNAFTSHDFAAYFETLRADRLPIVMRLEADRMRNLVLDEEDFSTERKVVVEERRLRVEDRPKDFLREQFRAAAFQAQPYQWPIIGWMQDLQRLTLADARAFYDTYYRPENAFIVVVGAVSRDAVLSELEDAFGGIAAGPAPPRFSYSDPTRKGILRLEVKKPAELPFLMLGYAVPNLQHADSYVLEVIAALLSRGKSARLYETLVRGEQIALRVEAQHPLLSLDPDLFTVSAEPRPGVNPADLETAVVQQVDRLRREPVAPKELQRAKNQLEADFIFNQDSLFFQAMLLARYEIVGDWRRIDEYLPAIRKVSADDVQRVARNYLVDDNLVVGRLMPLPLGNQ
jgi:zinc protease